MDNLYICPGCKNPGEGVPLETVDSLTKDFLMPDEEDPNYHICFTPDCKIVYFNNEISKKFKLGTIKTQVWFKTDSNDDCPICYCSNLTRGQIKEGVMRGLTTAEEIRDFFDKHHTGDCLTKNPMGRCCHRFIEQEIELYSD